jgi:hypothetical protein
MTTPSRDTVVLQKDDLREGFAPSGRQRGRVPRGANLGSRGISSETIAQMTGFPSAIIISNEDGVSRTLFMRQKSLSAEFDLSRR